MFILNSTLDNIVPVVVIIGAAVAVLTLGIAIYLLILQNIVSGYFSSKKFAVKSKHKVEPLTGEEKFELMVFNNNLIEARILSFGFLYRSNSVDFFDTYTESVKLEKDAKVIIMSRDFIKLEIEAALLQDLIKKHNDGRVRVEPIYAYVTDISGHIIKYPAREVRKIIYRHFKAIDDARKAEEKAKKQEEAAKRRIERKAKRDACMANFKSKFTPKQKEEPKPEQQPKPQVEETKPAPEEKSE
jgi:hypothetical protein